MNITKLQLSERNAAELRFRARIAELGGTVKGTYLGAHIPVVCACARGHECKPRPNSIQKGQGMCPICVRNDPVSAEERFRAQIAKLGGTVIGPYRGAHTPVDCVCASGHRCKPDPASVNHGQGICKSCAATRRARTARAAAEASFRARVQDLGGVVAGEYRNSQTPVSCICHAGHRCNPRPNSLRGGQGMCKVCAGNDPATAEAKFRARISELGGQIVGVYQNTATPVACVCLAGHECAPWPGSVNNGRGICRRCAGNSIADGEARFRASLAALDAVLLSSYRGANESHLVQCAAGHEVWILPRQLRGAKRGICITCAGHDPRIAERDFRIRLASYGATLLEPYRNAQAPHHVRCADGHDCYPRPNSLQQGAGPCRKCAGLNWDVFYVVTNQAQLRVKFGITSTTSRRRLRVHRQAGYENVALIRENLPGSLAPDAEKAVIKTLVLAGMPAVRGREYYDISALPIIIDVATGWLDGAQIDD